MLRLPPADTKNMLKVNIEFGCRWKIDSNPKIKVIKGQKVALDKQYTIFVRIAKFEELIDKYDL